ncbi:MAG: YkgJ family cysteine cluster protein [Candidatus Nanoarchaeia archaeon]
METLKGVGITAKTPSEYIKKLALNCEKCGHCCTYGSGYFLNDDIKRISSHMGVKKEQFIKDFLEEKRLFNTRVYCGKTKRNNKPFGPCIFFDSKEGCVIHEVKPFHCSLSMGCGEYGEYIALWFTLNYLVNPNDPESIRQWANYLQTHPTLPGGELHELVPDREKRRKILNYEILGGINE